MTAEDLINEPTVQRWLRSAKLDTAPREEQLAQVEPLARFCARRGQSPQQLVDSCFLEKTADGQYQISIKGRREMDAAIEEFTATLGLPRHYAIATGNIIRGFLVHNGVLIQSRPSIP